MTDRFNALLVVLHQSVRDDDLEDSLINAIKQLRGVADVIRSAPEGFEHQVAKMQVQTEMREKIWKVLTD